MQLSNFHTHTVYSDGHDTVQEMIETALENGFHAIGFSDHSYAYVERDYCMPQEKVRENLREIRAWGEEYKDRIAVYAGLELDAESSRPLEWDISYDYLISSVHEIFRRGRSMPIDESADRQKELIRDLFGGDVLEFAHVYFDALAMHVNTTKTDIVGHFDLVTKYGLMPEDDDRYRRYALEAIEEIMKTCRTFELNTGAIARGLRTVPYPAAFLLDAIKSRGGRVIITSDCHYRAKLTCWFAEAEEFLAAHGFRKNPHADLNDRVRDIEIWE